MQKQSELKSPWILLLAILTISTCGLIYELVAGTLASYLLGDSVMQFSTIIGVYLFSMGIGSFLAKYIDGNLLHWFIRIELLVALIGGFTSSVLFILYPLTVSFQLLLYSLVCLTGILVGLEIPLLMRILEHKIKFKELVSRVFTFDYLGALLASLIFPIILIPHLGLIRTSLLFGMMNIGVGMYLLFFFKEELPKAGLLRITAVVLLFLELFAFVLSEKIVKYSETLAFNDDIVYAVSSPYQRIVLTRNKREMRLFLNGNLQFSTADEYRYHEALVHPALSSVDAPKNILVLGGGDGLAVRELLKYTSIEKIILVDLDAEITKLFKTQSLLKHINEQSLNNSKVTIINKDAFIWIKENRDLFDAIIIDFPDPSNYSIGKLYTNLFYLQLKKALQPNGIIVVQSTSPYVAPKSFWCINTTMQSVGFITRPYHNYVPSFGEWGYIIGSFNNQRIWFKHLPENLKFINNETLSQLFIFPEDMKTKEILVPNKLNNQSLVQYFDEEWSKYLE